MNFIWRAARKANKVVRGLREDAAESHSALPKSSRPEISVVVVVYEIPREAPRTLLSLSASYQRHIDPDDYEVIVVDNGSSPPIDSKMIEGLAGNFRLIQIQRASPSPVAAVNRGLAEARGDVIGVMIDGARIATPGLLHFARHGARLYERAVVAALGWYLGHDYQRWAMQGGYDRTREDALLTSIGWPLDGYRLFEIGTMDESSVDGWLAPISESNGLFMRRATWELLGGLDERFDSPGGGIINLDTFRRAAELSDAELVVLLGEGTFHQFHGGVATNTLAKNMRDSWTKWADQYRAIRGRPYELPSFSKPPTYIGTLPRPALARFVHAALHPALLYATPAPLGPDFDQVLWSFTPPSRSSDTTIAALVELAHSEFRAQRYPVTAAIARLIRARAPDEPEPQRLLSLVAPWLPSEETPSHSRTDYHLALGEAHRLLGENDMATGHYRAALAINPNLVRAHIGLATLRMPGDFYYTWLDRLYTALAPETVIEIGVAEGASLAFVRPPTIAIGVDPNPKAAFPLKANTHIFAETSDEFFSRRRHDSLLRGRPLSIGFIDGLHLYEQVLKDFINLERYCGPRSVILIHDTIALDEPTQSRACNTQFHTGDVWKTVLCLKHYRPDLDIFTIATPWTGLTVVTGLDPEARGLADRYEEAVARFIDMPFSDIENRLDTALDIVPNDWNVVEARLKARKVL